MDKNYWQTAENKKRQKEARKKKMQTEIQRAQK